MKKKIILLSFLGLIIILSTTYLLIKFIPSLDVVGKESITSFEVVVDKLENNISFSDEWKSWELNAPDETAKFYWSRDFSESTFHDIMLEFSAEPFLTAGLNTNELPEGMYFNEMIMVGMELGDSTINYSQTPTPLESYKKIVELKRSIINYHGELDHYGVDLGNGNMFEWAKNIESNDKDIVFVVNPEPFINAGVNPENVEGWMYAKVPIMKDGEKIEVYKFLKPFNLD